MTKFLLFAGSVYYPGGGWHDFRGGADSREEIDTILKAWLAEETPWAAESRDRFLWAHVYDVQTGKIEEVDLCAFPELPTGSIPA